MLRCVQVVSVSLCRVTGPGLDDLAVRRKSEANDRRADPARWIKSGLGEVTS